MLSSLKSPDHTDFDDFYPLLERLRSLASRTHSAHLNSTGGPHLNQKGSTDNTIRVNKTQPEFEFEANILKSTPFRVLKTLYAVTRLSLTGLPKLPHNSLRRHRRPIRPNTAQFN